MHEFTSCLKTKELGDEKGPSHFTWRASYCFAECKSCSSPCATCSQRSRLLEATNSSFMIPNHLRLSSSTLHTFCLQPWWGSHVSLVRSQQSIPCFSWKCFFKMFHNQPVHLVHKSRDNLDVSMLGISLQHIWVEFIAQNLVLRNCTFNSPSVFISIYDPSLEAPLHRVMSPSEAKSLQISFLYSQCPAQNSKLL